MRIVPNVEEVVDRTAGPFNNFAAFYIIRKKSKDINGKSDTSSEWVDKLSGKTTASGLFIQTLGTLG